MPRCSTLTLLVVGALFAASCGGNGDGEAGSAVSQSTATASADTDTDTDDEPTATLTPADTLAPDVGESDGGGTTSFGPTLEPTTTFPIPEFTGLLPGVAVSPTGDRVAIMWVDSDFSTNLAVYDTDSGAELAAIVDDRLDGDVFWTIDDRIITGGNFGTIWQWNPTTLDAISDDPLIDGPLGCGSGNGTVFDPVAGALFLKSNSLCRIDVTTGTAVQYESDTPTSLLAVAVGGSEVYLRGTDAAGEGVLRVLDATTLDLISEQAATPNPVIAASVNGVIEQRDGGFDYEIQPSGRLVEFYTAGITTSSGGGYYVGKFDGGIVVVSSVDGMPIGTIDDPEDSAIKTAWSGDDTVLVALTENEISVFRGS